MPKEWSDQFSLNHTMIDEQHKKLFKLSNTIEVLDSQTCKEDLATLLKELFAYMREHFSEEEAYMQSISYPMLDEHRKKHEEIIEETTKLLKETKSMIALQKKLKTTSKHYFVQHILDHDLKIEKWRKSTIIEPHELEVLETIAKHKG